ncbi:MAG: hypothetical protein IJO61_03930, partial [Oscillospiraceae bacterium]|nr:hypothetical protein [Oscillospiraceae bacterium]
IKNIRFSKDMEKPLALRIPLIGGFNASKEDAYGFCKLFDLLGVKENITLELLPYHEYGKDKYKSLGMEYQMTEDAFVSKENLSEIEKIFLESKIKLIKT